MRLKTMKDGAYLFVKLRPEDWKYLKVLKKNENAITIRNTEKYLAETTSIHIKSVFVMLAAMILRNKGTLKKNSAKKIFNELDIKFSIYDMAIDKYYKKLGQLLFKKYHKNKKLR